MKMAFVPRFPVAAVILALLCGTALQVTAQQPAQQQDTIPGYRSRFLRIYDERTGDPIEGAKVSDMSSGKSSLSSGTGRVGLGFLPDGASVISIQKIGYAPRTATVTMSPADTMPLILRMRALASGQSVQLPTVTTTAAAPYISPGLRRFQEREKTGATGYFINDTTLRKSEGHLLSDVMRPRMPGASFRDGPHGAVYLSSRCGIPQVYLDGVPLVGEPPAISSSRRNAAPPPRATPFNLSQLQVSDIGGMEWYPTSASAPIEYSGTAATCGVLLLWTRER